MEDLTIVLHLRCHDNWPGDGTRNLVPLADVPVEFAHIGNWLVGQVDREFRITEKMTVRYVSYWTPDGRFLAATGIVGGPVRLDPGDTLHLNPVRLDAAVLEAL